MEDTQAQATTDEFEVIEMLRVDTRRRIDLKCVVIVCRIFKKTVEGVKHLVRQEEEEFSTVDASRSIFSMEPGTRTLKDHRNLNHPLHRT